MKWRKLHWKGRIMTDEKLERAAEEFAQRDRHELREADARSRNFKAGAAYQKSQSDAVIEKLIKVLQENCCIDDCGLDVNAEPIEILRACMKSNDEVARAVLAELEQSK
jgi:predicted DNA-binding helix-hairpin-helix protein